MLYVSDCEVLEPTYEGEDKMVVVKVDKETCIGCGVCESVCGDVFLLGDDGKSGIVEAYRKEDNDAISVGEVPDDLASCVDEAIESCPTEAIKKE